MVARPLDMRDVGGRAWLKQFVGGVPMIGELVGRRVYPTATFLPSKLSQEEPLEGAEGRTNFAKGRKGPSVRKLWEEARHRSIQRVCSRPVQVHTCRISAK